MSLPTPINWLRGGRRIDAGLLVVTLIPLNHENWICSQSGHQSETMTNNEGVETEIDKVPGPVQWAIPIYDYNTEEIKNEVGRHFGAIMQGLAVEFSKEHSHREYEDNIKFTPNQVPEVLIKKNPDAITAVSIGDNDGDELWEIWAHVYQWESQGPLKGEWK